MSLPPDYGYVLLALGSTWFANFYLAINVIRARKKYGVKYPDLYADNTNKNAKAFNCVQRAHQNTLEVWAPISILVALNGFVMPQVSAFCGLMFTVSRIIYGAGYKSSPEGRRVGSILYHIGCDIPLILLTFYNGYQMIQV